MKQIQVKLSDLQPGDLIKIERKNNLPYFVYNYNFSMSQPAVNQNSLCIFLSSNIEDIYCFYKNKFGFILKFNKDKLYKILL